MYLGEGATRPAGRRDRRDDRAGRLFAWVRKGAGEGGKFWVGRSPFAADRGGGERLPGGGRENLLRKEEDAAHQLPPAHGEAHLYLSLESGVWTMVVVGYCTGVEVFADRPVQPRRGRATSCRCGVSGLFFF